MQGHAGGSENSGVQEMSTAALIFQKCILARTRLLNTIRAHTQACLCICSRGSMPNWGSYCVRQSKLRRVRGPEWTSHHELLPPCYGVKVGGPLQAGA